MTHEQEEAFELGDRVAVLNAGRLEQVGTPEELFEKPETRFVATFIGRSSVVPVVWESAGARLPHGPVWPAIPGAPVAEGSDADLVVRPEALEFTARPRPDALPGEVAERRYAGRVAYFRVADRSRRRDRGPRAAARGPRRRSGVRGPGAWRPGAPRVSAIGDGVRLSRGRPLVAAALAILLFWLVGYPLVLTLLEALGAPRFTLAHFADFARRPAEWQALWASLWISLVTVILSAAIGVPLAFLFERAEFPGRRALGVLVALPVALPPLVGVIAFLFLYGESGFASRAVQAVLRLEQPPWRLSGPAAILLVHAYSMYVYFYLFTRAGLARLDVAYLEAAKSLGAGRWRTAFAVTLPLLSPALSGAALLTFMTSLASFSAPYVFGGSFRVMTTQIVASKLNGDIGLAMVETVALAAVGFAGLYLLRRTEARSVVGTVRGVAPAAGARGRALRPRPPRDGRSPRCSCCRTLR